MEKKSATRLDIARRAGTSVSVVSRALNNSGYVAKEKKERILKIAEELNYAPNPVGDIPPRRTGVEHNSAVQYFVPNFFGQQNFPRDNLLQGNQLFAIRVMFQIL